VFFEGGLGKVDFECGFFVVSLWWNAWFLWTEDATSRGAKKHATDLRFIFTSGVEKGDGRSALGRIYQSSEKL
jgi:hypothetical protein